MKKRLKKLAEGRALLIAPHLNPKTVRGVASNLVVKSSSPDVKRICTRIASEAGDSLIVKELYAEPFAAFSLVTPNVAEAHRLHRYAREQKGVIDARLYLLQDIIRNPEELQTDGAFR